MATKISLVSCKVTVYKCLQHTIVHQKISCETFLLPKQSRLLGRLVHREFKLDVIGNDFHQYNFNKKSILFPPQSTTNTTNKRTRPVL